jgi:hypothetical protein
MQKETEEKLTASLKESLSSRCGGVFGIKFLDDANQLGHHSTQFVVPVHPMQQQTRQILSLHNNNIPHQNFRLGNPALQKIITR